MTPTCYPALQLSKAWTEESDSKTGGACTITPGTTTSPMRVNFAPEKSQPKQPWANAYILHRNAGSRATMWNYCTSVTFPTQQDITNLNAYEQDFQKNDGGVIVNLGWQFLSGKGLRLWNRAGKAWQAPVLPPEAAVFVPGVPKRIVLLFSHDSSHVTYVGIGIDGAWTQLNVSYPTIGEVQRPYVNNAVQLDSKGQGAPINFALNECNLTGF